tara:strand:- start:91206 stop:91397 length:192 start_codon:yes stop_codon:yes gene_type:complete
MGIKHMNTPYDKKIENVAGEKDARPQSAFKYGERKQSLLKFAAIFFAVMVVGTLAVTILLKAN